SDNCRHVSQEAIQLHGGMGMSDELKVSHSFRRLTMIAQQFGDAEHHLARFARLS
ncbi:MAG: acyl-CoA dehydrogenase family protein, partial [Pseudomonadota bacterium]